MPIHDWTRVTSGTGHDFHLAWIAELRNALNDGLLPDDYYAQAEQIAGPLGHDVLTLERSDLPTNGQREYPEDVGGVAVAVAPPRMRITDETDMNDYVLKRRTLVIRHGIVALVELVSPGNKSSNHRLRAFVEKAVEALYRGYHLLVVDLFPVGPRDVNGIHGAIGAEVSDRPFSLPPDEPLTLAAYSAGPSKRAYVEPTAIGRTLIDMPLFLDPEVYINVPLEATYHAAYRGVPKRWKSVLERAEASE